jgi:hypothetical protein
METKDKYITPETEVLELQTEGGVLIDSIPEVDDT